MTDFSVYVFTAVLFLVSCPPFFLPLPPPPLVPPLCVPSKQEALRAGGVADNPSRRQQGCRRRFIVGRLGESTRIVVVYPQVQGRPREASRRSVRLLVILIGLDWGGGGGGCRTGTFFVCAMPFFSHRLAVSWFVAVYKLHWAIPAA